MESNERMELTLEKYREWENLGWDKRRNLFFYLRTYIEKKFRLPQYRKVESWKKSLQKERRNGEEGKNITSSLPSLSCSSSSSSPSISGEKDKVTENERTENCCKKKS